MLARVDRVSMTPASRWPGVIVQSPERRPATLISKLCERLVDGAPCAKGDGGARAPAVEQVEGVWYCARHQAAAKARAAKRRDKGFGPCEVVGWGRPAAEDGGRCVEHRAGLRAAGGESVAVDDTSGKGEHPYAPKLAEIYLALFPDTGRIKVGKATPWTVRGRVRDAAEKLRARQAEAGADGAVAAEPVAWSIALFGERPVLWAVSERVEHAAAGRLAHNVRANSVEHAEGKEWLGHDDASHVDWPTEFHRAVRETLVFLGYAESEAAPPRTIG